MQSRPQNLRRAQMISYQLHQTQQFTLIDNLFNEAYGNKNLGMPLIGHLKNLDKLTGETVERFRKENLSADRILFTASGLYSHIEFQNLVANYTSHYPALSGWLPFCSRRKYASVHFMEDGGLPQVNQICPIRININNTMNMITQCKTTYMRVRAHLPSTANAPKRQRPKAQYKGGERFVIKNQPNLQLALAFHYQNYDLSTIIAYRLLQTLLNNKISSCTVPPMGSTPPLYLEQANHLAIGVSSDPHTNSSSFSGLSLIFASCKRLTAP